VLVLAEKPTRPANFLLLRASNLSPPAFDSLEDFQTSSEKIGIATAALNTGSAGLAHYFVTETELFAAGPTTRRRNRRQEQVSDKALIKDLSELRISDPVVHSTTALAATGD
jgi:transcription-repair coupling factor (superfamily II helicase)